ncbi:MAG: glucosamine-6-phosphate deaminase [Candidatus Omnitrophica bacterium]|nr:glucosamine-6-phosphate deaminase [Candidatus Omnitrophota bacterium]
MEVIVKDSYEEMSTLAAQIIADLIRKKPNCVLGLATGSTPVGTYKELIRLHKNEGLDFSKVTTFNLDEYVGLLPDHDQSYRYFMNKNLFKDINIKKQNTNVPNGMADDIPAACEAYERKIKKAGGLDIQLLGIGANGHIAFNEPGSSLGSRTRVKTLDERTRQDNARFFKSLDEVPRYAVTMGIGTIMEARQLILLANKDNKADAIAMTVEGPITAMVPATIVQLHPKATIITDKAAASKLTREYPAEPSILKLQGREESCCSMETPRRKSARREKVGTRR